VFQRVKVQPVVFVKQKNFDAAKRLNRLERRKENARKALAASQTVRIVGA
jgi:hypothetical protein